MSSDALRHISDVSWEHSVLDLDTYFLTGATQGQSRISLCLSNLHALLLISHSHD